MGDGGDFREHKSRNHEKRPLNTGFKGLGLPNEDVFATSKAAATLVWRRSSSRQKPLLAVGRLAVRVDVQAFAFGFFGHTQTQGHVDDFVGHKSHHA